MVEFSALTLTMVIIKELVEEFERQFTCLGENVEKCITFSFPIEKRIIRIDKSRKWIKKNYVLENSLRFMTSSLSILVNNLTEGIHKTKFKHGHDYEKCETCWIKYKDCECFLEYTNFYDGLKEYRCLCRNKNHQKKLDENLKKRFVNT